MPPVLLIRSLPDQLPPGILPDLAVACQALRFLESDHRAFGSAPEIAVNVGGFIAAADEECLGDADDGAAGAGADGRQRGAGFGADDAVGGRADRALERTDQGTAGRGGP